jgi:hypothetical protein
MFTNWLNQLFGAVRQGRRSPHRSSCVRRTPRPTARPWLETLESRYAPSVTVSVIGTVLTAQCDNTVANTVTVDHAGTSANINGTIVPDAMYTSIDVEGGAMGTTTNILANVAPVTVNDSRIGLATPDPVNVGNAGTLSGIQASVALENEPGYVTLNIHDELDAAAHTAVIDMVPRLGDTALGRITGLGVPDITWDYYDTAAVNLNFGAGTSTVNVLATADVNGTQAITNVFNVAPATINVGNAGSLVDIRGPLNLENEPDLDTVYINDYNDATAHTAVIDAVARPLDPDQSSLGRLTGLGVGAITWDYFDTSAVNVNLGSGTSMVNLLATGNIAAGTTYATTTNVFNVAAATINVGNAGSLAGILGQLNLENETSFDTVNISDTADAANHTASITTITRSGDTSLGALNGLGAAQITWDYNDTSSVTINSGTGFVIWHIEGTGVSTTINGTLGTNAFVVCQASQDLSNIVGALTLNGSGSGTNVLEFYDQANVNSETYTFDAVPSSLNLTTEPVSVNFTGVGAVYLETNGTSTVVDPSTTVLVDTGTEPY